MWILVVILFIDGNRVYEPIYDYENICLYVYESR